MVAYEPPDPIINAIGAAQHGDALAAAADRILPLAAEDAELLQRFGHDEEAQAKAERLTRDLKNLLKDPRSSKNENPVQMGELPELMAQIRAWLKTLREIAAVNLGEDAPALARLSSSAPEVPAGYPRDLLQELEIRLSSAGDLKPRLEEVGLSDRFLGRGRRLAAQLKTAIGAKDLDPKNLSLGARRYYLRKGQVYLALKRVAAIGRLAFCAQPERAAAYHLGELEPPRIEPPPGAAKPG